MDGYDWHFAVVLQRPYLLLLWEGLLTTLKLTGSAMILGTPLGIAWGSIPFLAEGRFRLSEPAPLRRMSWATLKEKVLILLSNLSVLLIDVIRAVPLLLLILTSYYVFPVIVNQAGPLTVLFGRYGSGAIEVTGFTCAAVALAINLAAFIADLVRGAARAVDKGNVLAARSLGMSWTLTWRRIILPDVVREIVPGLTLLYITILKMSTLASVIALYEILHAAGAVIQKTYRPLEIYVLVCGVFVALVLPLSWGARKLEQSKWFRRRS